MEIFVQGRIWLLMIWINFYFFLVLFLCYFCHLCAWQPHSSFIFIIDKRVLRVVFNNVSLSKNDRLFIWLSAFNKIISLYSPIAVSWRCLATPNSPIWRHGCACPLLCACPGAEIRFAPCCSHPVRVTLETRAKNPGTVCENLKWS